MRSSSFFPAGPEANSISSPGPSCYSLLFMSGSKKIFGTDGVRGTANIEPVTAETALRLGRAAGHVFKSLETRARGAGRHKIVLGKDTRLSGYMIENALDRKST